MHVICTEPQNDIHMPQRVESTSRKHFRLCKELKLTSYCTCWLEMWGGWGFLVQKFLRYKLDGSCVYG